MTPSNREKFLEYGKLFLIWQLILSIIFGVVILCLFLKLATPNDPKNTLIVGFRLTVLVVAGAIVNLIAALIIAAIQLKLRKIIPQVREKMGQAREFSRQKQAQKERLTGALETHRNGQWLKRPEASITELGGWVREVLGEEPVRGLLATVETEAKYSGYIAQQERQMVRLRDAEGRVIPSAFEFAGIPGLSREIQDKLARVRPGTLGQAARIPGVTPAAIAILDCYLSVSRVC